MARWSPVDVVGAIGGWLRRTAAEPTDAAWHWGRAALLVGLQPRNVVHAGVTFWASWGRVPIFVDPFTLAAIAIIALTGTGAAGVSVARSRRLALRAGLREAVRTPIPCGQAGPVSLFDVFWDLGASDFAIEVMAARKLLLASCGDLAAMYVRLPDCIEEHGGYEPFIAASLEGIQEYYQDHRNAGDRRKIIGLAAPAGRALPAPKDADAVATALAVPYEVDRAADPGTVRERIASRRGETSKPLGGFATEAMDLDELLTTDAGRIVGSLLDGSIGREVKRWFGFRSARKLRAELDKALCELHRLYAAEVRTDAQAIAHLYDTSRRWQADAMRVARDLEVGAYAKREFGACAVALFEEARDLANTLAESAKANVDETLAEIDQRANGGEVAQAGYLVYVNRYAFFVGHMDLCERWVTAVENASARLQAELRKQKTPAPG